MILVLTSCCIQGDTLSIDVVDKLFDNSLDLVTSIVRSSFGCSVLRKSDAFFLQHWHGMFQKTTNYVDGADSVNQCPLIPLESFLYQFSTTNQAVKPSCMCRKMLNQPTL